MGYQDREFTVGVVGAKAKTFLRLNSILESVNNDLYQGQPFTMQVREDPAEDEMKQLITSGGIRFLRDA